MRSFNLPSLSTEPSLSIEPSRQPRSAAATGTTPLPESDQPAKHPAQEHPPSGVPATATATPRKERISVFAMLARLHASFARAEAVHQARLDDFWAGPERHMLAHYTYSAK